MKPFFSIVLAIFRLELFSKLFDHIIYGNIKTRYNVFRKCANDVFGEYDFMVPKLLKSYIIRPLRKSPRSEAFKSCLLQRNDWSYTPDEVSLIALLDAWCYAPCCATLDALGAIFTDSLCLDYPAQVTTRRLSMTVAVAVAIEEASKYYNGLMKNMKF